MKHPAHLLIIDDEPQLRNMLQRLFAGEGYQVTTAEDGAHGLKQVKSHDFDVVLCDVRLPDANGVELSKAIKALRPATDVIVLTAFGNIQDAVQAMRNGASHYLVKGDDNDKLIPTLAQAAERAQQRRAGTRSPASRTFDAITGRSAAIQQVVALAKKVAPTEATVLLTGATGTGKEVFAQAIHAASPRAQKPFVAVNCAALSRELIESELFGHLAGAFTGAVKDKKGLIDAAKGGTLFLDEVGELPTGSQAKLLRVLETGDYLGVGDTAPKKADVRLIAATHRDLSQDISAGRFRQDLYYRLSAFMIRLPGLAERKEDIPPLVEEFITQNNARLRKNIGGMEEAVKRRLLAHTWPGHVRELRNVIERACILCDGPILDLASIPLDMQSADGRTPGSGLDLESVEREHIRRVLIRTGGNKTLAAELLGIGRTTLYAKVKKYDL